MWEYDCIFCFFLTAVKFDRGGFPPFFSPPGRLVFAPPPGSPGYWRTAPSWTAGCWGCWCCPPYRKHRQSGIGSFPHKTLASESSASSWLYQTWVFSVVSVITPFYNDNNNAASQVNSWDLGIIQQYSKQVWLSRKHEQSEEETCFEQPSKLVKLMS